MTALNLSQSSTSSFGMTGLNLSQSSTSSGTMEEEQSPICVLEQIVDKNKNEEKDNSSSEEEDDDDDDDDDSVKNSNEVNVNTNKKEEDTVSTRPFLTADIVDDSSQMELDPEIIKKTISDLLDTTEPVDSDLSKPKQVDINVPDTTQMETDPHDSQSSSSDDEDETSSSSEDADDEQVSEENDDKDEPMPEADSGFPVQDDLNMSNNSSESSSLKTQFKSRMDEVMKSSSELNDKVAKLSKLVRTDKYMGKDHPFKIKVSSFISLARCLVCVDKDEVAKIGLGMKLVGNYDDEADPYRFDIRIGFAIDKLIEDINPLFEEYGNILKKEMQNVAKGRRPKKDKDWS